MTLSKVIRAQEEILTSQSGSATTNMSCISQKHAAKTLPEIAHSALPGDTIAGASITGRLFFGSKSKPV